MWGLDKLKEWIDISEEDFDEDEFEELEEEETEIAEPQKAVVGASVPAAPVAKPKAFVPAGTGTMQRPKLTVHTTKVPELAMEIHVPSNFEQVARIADDLLANRATIVNFERVETKEQQRIFDFINGVSYVLDCAARRVSPVMMLYVPNGVDVATALPRPTAR